MKRINDHFHLIISFFSNQVFKNRHKKHFFYETDLNNSYVIEEDENNQELYIMTACKAGVKKWDYIVIYKYSLKQVFEIKQIEYYYGDIPNLFIVQMSLITKRN